MPAPRKRDSLSVAVSTRVRFEDCLAKTTADGRPGISVRDHCLNVGCVANALLASLPQQLTDLLPPGAATLAALHDIGKVSPGFQQKCMLWLTDHKLIDTARRDWGLCETNHGKVTAFTLRDHFRAKWGGDRWERVAHCVGAHHGSLFGMLFAKPPKSDPTEWAAPARSELLAELEDLLGELPGEPEELPEPALWYLAGLISVADWIGSDERFFSPVASDQPRGIEAEEENARGAIAKIGWGSHRLLPGLTFADLFGFEKPSDLQRRAAEVAGQPAVVLIEASMGSGKTEAALALAYRVIGSGAASGLYFALPTQATSNRIHARVGEFLRRASSQSTTLRLAHANSWLRDDSCVVAPSAGDHDPTPGVVQNWFASAKRALLAPYGVGTIDQALIGVVAAKHFFVRQFALAGKIVVLDEVHSYDLYTGTLVDHLIKRLRQLGATLVVLSATLTTQRKRELLGLPQTAHLSNSYPAISVLPSGGESLVQRRCQPEQPKEVTVRCVGLSEGDAAAECLRRAEGGECALWIRNTVSEAQSAFRMVSSIRREGGPPAALLHARFPQFRREKLERLWLNRLGKNPRRRPRGCVLVATQVVEQSVDIDGDFLLTDLAPTDMLLQRVGRLWRHQELPAMAARRPSSARREVWVNCPVIPNGADARNLKKALGKSARVYAPYVLLRSLDEWRKVARRGTLVLPGDIRRLLDGTYKDAASRERAGWAELRRELEERRRTLQDRAEAVARVWSIEELDDEEGVQTRWSDTETGKLLLVRRARRLGHALELRPLFGQQFTVRPSERRLEAAKAIHRNITPLDAWMIREGRERMSDLPPGLDAYVRGPFALGIVRSERNGPLYWPGQAEPSRLFYDEDAGVEYQPPPHGGKSQSWGEDDDESRD